MRYQGRITEWNDDRGFGFINPNGGGPRVFIHFRSLKSGEPRPQGGELVTYVEVPVSGKGPRAEQVAYVDRTSRKNASRTSAPQARKGDTLSMVIAGGLLVAIVCYGALKYGERREAFRNSQQFDQRSTPAETTRPMPLAAQVTSGSPPTSFRCEGKTRCSQMASCEEAKFYLKNCPDVKIDGDNDGIPCEQEWCK